MKEQCRNRSTNRIVECRGEKISLAEAAEKYGINYHMLFARLKLGWTIEEAISRPKRNI